MWAVLVNILREYAAAVTAAGGHGGGGDEARLACRLLNQCTYTPGIRTPAPMRISFVTRFAVLCR